MLVKRYVVKEMPEAVAMIREDLGKDAVILSTKKVQSRGFLGLFAKTHIEVIAAANEAEPKNERPPVNPIHSVARPVAMGAYQQSKAQVPDTEKRTVEPPFSTAVVAQQVPAQTAVVPSPPVAPAVQPIIRQQEPERVDAPVIQKVEFPVINPRVERPTTTPAVRAPEASTQVADDTVLKEVQELRLLLRSLVNSSSTSMLPESVITVRKQLLAQDLEEELVDELIEKGIRQFQQIQSIDEQEFRGILLNFIKEELVAVAEPLPLGLQTRIVSLMGPTGVGKTTTIAKLAAEQVLKYGKRVGLITTDTYRIAAVDQLRTYANILNVPLEVCYSPEDVDRALEQFADRDLILVDTAGRNYYNDLNVRELNAYLQVLHPDETYLVLSLTTKVSDLMQIAENFTKLTIDKFLFTKMDETKTYGAMYNVVSRHKVPLSYVTTGQNVPEDIEVVSAEKVARLIVGERTDV
ncbi:MAG: flagellar biosynthesis protein FlhF [Tumebacillaceae bacterium]